MEQNKSAILVGVGGQGTILTAKVLVNGLMRAGYDVKMSEVHGMSQRIHAGALGQKGIFPGDRQGRGGYSRGL